MLFEFGQPGEQVAIEELDRRQIREMAADRPLLIDLPLARALLGIGADAIEILTGVFGGNLGQRRFERLHLTVAMAGQECARGIELRRDRRRNVGFRGQALEHQAVQLHRFRLAIEGNEHFALGEDRRQVERVAGKGLLKAAELLRAQAKRALGAGKIEPQRRRGFDGDAAIEALNGRLRITQVQLDDAEQIPRRRNAGFPRGRRAKKIGCGDAVARLPQPACFSDRLLDASATGDHRATARSALRLASASR